jgi:outer membrane protein OmpA-like peptidoglycan-associated protein
VELDNALWGSQFYARTGGAFQINDQGGTAIEYIDARAYSSTNSMTKPKELLISGWKRVGEAGVNIRGGWGVGLNNAISVPKYRILFSIGVEPPEVRDTDQDGIFDDKDDCIDNPEDLDGISDDDGCPEPTPVTVVIVNQFGDQVKTATWTNGTQNGKSQDTYNTFASDGPVEFTAKADGHEEARISLSIPDAEQFRVKLEIPAILGQLTVSTVDTEGNPITDSTWSIQEQERYQNLRSDRPTAVVPGQWLIVAGADGHKTISKKVVVKKERDSVIVLELPKAKAKISGNKIEISEKVQFESGSDLILENSHGLLDEIVEILQTNPNLNRLRIEGHTDSRGDDSMNKDLSQKRAEAVMAYLNEKGVNPDRMEAIGLGETQPIATNDTPDGRAANRRVVFHISDKKSE